MSILKENCDKSFIKKKLKNIFLYYIINLLWLMYKVKKKQ